MRETALKKPSWGGRGVAKVRTVGDKRRRSSDGSGQLQAALARSMPNRSQAATPMNSVSHAGKRHRSSTWEGEPVETGDYLGKLNLKGRRSSTASHKRAKVEVKIFRRGLPS